MGTLIFWLMRGLGHLKESFTKKQDVILQRPTLESESLLVLPTVGQNLLTDTYSYNKKSIMVVG